MAASLAAPSGPATAWLTPWLAQLPPPAGDLAAVQQRGRRALAEQPLPGSRDEAWRFTDLSLLAQLSLAPAGAAAPAGARDSWASRERSVKRQASSREPGSGCSARARRPRCCTAARSPAGGGSWASQGVSQAVAGPEGAARLAAIQPTSAGVRGSAASRAASSSSTQS